MPKLICLRTRTLFSNLILCASKKSRLSWSVQFFSTTDCQISLKVCEIIKAISLSKKMIARKIIVLFLFTSKEIYQKAYW
jgi:hypothetical protein